MKLFAVLNWDKLSQQRSWLFSISIILIIFSHFSDDISDCENINFLFGTFAHCYNGLIGSVGVDIFCLLSGIGLYFSYSRNHNTLDFYKRRFSRLLIAYIPIAGIFWIIKDFLVQNNSFSTFIADFSVLSFWTEGKRSVWFMSYIALMYLCFPLIFALLKGDRIHCEIKVLLLFCLLCALLLFMHYGDYAFYINTEVALWRVLPFVLGVYLGAIIFNKWELNISPFFIILFGIVLKLVFIVVTLSGYAVLPARLVSCFWAISLSYLFSFIFERVRSIWLITANNMLSVMTLELYLLHVCLRSLLRDLNIPTHNVFVFVGYVTLSLFLSLICIKIKRRYECSR